MNWRNVLAGVGSAGFATVIVSLAILSALDGFSIDSLFWLRHKAFGSLHDQSTSPTAIIAIDEETYRRPPFERVPKALWTPQLANVMKAALDGGAVVIGQDVILPTSVENFLPGFDREYLLFARDASRDGRLVLGRVQHSSKPISPFPGYSFAVANEQNIRLVNLFRDSDGVIRRMPLVFQIRDPAGQERTEASMALELAARAIGVRPEIDEAGMVRLGDYTIPGSDRNAMLISFDTGGASIPVYSLADLWACTQSNGREFFRTNFANRLVLVGAVLDVEDRKTTSLRFATGPEGSWFGPRCVLPIMSSMFQESIVRDTVPGVVVIAAAVNNLLRQDGLAELDEFTSFVVCLLLTLGVALTTFSFRPWTAWLIVGFGSILWIAIVVVVFRTGWVLPLFDPVLAAAITVFLLVGYRFVVSDKEKRQIRRAFAYYLPSPVIDRMLDTQVLPALGGETRELTVFFSDLEGFTSLSEGLQPHEVVAFMNRYLSLMTEIIEENHGFVEKYAGDEVVAVFGAPLPNPDHASHAVKAALQCQAKLAKLPSGEFQSAVSPLRCRIGINTGQMLIGNIGSQRRFNYTVMGDAVNLASRLEQANKIYGTHILASQNTVSDSDSSILFRKIDRIRVRGRHESLTIYQPYERGSSDEAAVGRFEDALSLFVTREFDEAKAIFDELASVDPVAGYFAKRARQFSEEPPPQDWDGVTNLD